MTPFDRPILYYEEEEVASMQLHGADVAAASAGDEVGIISSLPKPDAGVGEGFPLQKDLVKVAT